MPEKKINFPLLNYLDKLVESLRELSARAVKGHDEEAVHDARVATRRLKAALDLLRPVLSGRRRSQMGKALRGLRRRLGVLRDADVMANLLAKTKSSRLEPAAKWLGEQIEESRLKTAARAAQALAPARLASKLGVWWVVREEIVAAKEAAGSLLAESIHLQLDAFADAAASLIQPDASVQSPHPHELRIAGKSLRYTLEMAKANGVKLPRSVYTGFKHMQTALGDWHDLVVLSQCAMEESLKEGVAFEDLPLQQGLLALSSDALHKAERQLTKATEFWRAQGALLTQQIRGSFSLTEPVTAKPEESRPADEEADTTLPWPSESAEHASPPPDSH